MLCRAAILISRTILKSRHIPEIGCGSDAILYELARQSFSGQNIGTLDPAKSGTKHRVSDFGGTGVLATLLDPTELFD